MYPERVIIRTDRIPDCLSTMKDDLNTLTFQSTNTHNALMEPLLFPITYLGNTSSGVTPVVGRFFYSDDFKIVNIYI